MLHAATSLVRATGIQMKHLGFIAAFLLAIPVNGRTKPSSHPHQVRCVDSVSYTITDVPSTLTSIPRDIFLCENGTATWNYTGSVPGSLTVAFSAADGTPFNKTDTSVNNWVSASGAAAPGGLFGSFKYTITVPGQTPKDPHIIVLGGKNPMGPAN